MNGSGANDEKGKDADVDDARDLDVGPAPDAYTLESRSRWERGRDARPSGRARFGLFLPKARARGVAWCPKLLRSNIVRTVSNKRAVAPTSFNGWTIIVGRPGNLIGEQIELKTNLPRGNFRGSKSGEFSANFLFAGPDCIYQGARTAGQDTSGAR